MADFYKVGKEEFMEQKKTLWIIASVGIFLLVILGAGLLIYSPNRTSQSASLAPVAKNTQNGWTKTDQNSLAIEAQTNSPNPNNQTVNDMFVISENTNILGLNDNNTDTTDVRIVEESPASTTIDLNALKRELMADSVTSYNPVVTQPQNINITVNIPESEKQEIVSVQSPVSVTSEYYTNVSANPQTLVKEEAPKVKENKTSEKKYRKTEKEVLPKKAVENVKAAPKEITRFWVQVASYENKKTAENARNALSDKKISSDIYTYEDNKDKLFYRVRVGPFTTKSEAEYWKAKIEELPDFKKAGSYITQTKN